MNYIDLLKSKIANADIEESLVMLKNIGSCLDIENKVIQLSSRYSILQKEEIKGTLKQETKILNINMLTHSLIQLVKIIEKDKTQLAKCIKLKSDAKQLHYFELIATIELVVNITNDILKENQAILSNYFTGEESVIDIKNKMVKLYHNQKNRGNFSTWILILESYLPKCSAIVKNEITVLVEILEELKTRLYSYEEIDISPERILDFEKEVEEGLWSTERINKFHLKLIHQFPPEKSKILVENYLNYLRDTIDEIEQIFVRIKINLNEQ